MTDAVSLTGRRVLVVEDEALIAMLIEETLADIGCETVGTASDLVDALDKVRALAFDVAILDINLNGQRSFPVAEALAARGIPFVISSGYGSERLPPALQGRPTLQKPFQLSDIEQALRAALA